MALMDSVDFEGHPTETVTGGGEEDCVSTIKAIFLAFCCCLIWTLGKYFWKHYASKWISKWTPSRYQRFTPAAATISSSSSNGPTTASSDRNPTFQLSIASPDEHMEWDDDDDLSSIVYKSTTTTSAATR